MKRLSLIAGGRRGLVASLAVILFLTCVMLGTAMTGCSGGESTNATASSSSSATSSADQTSGAAYTFTDSTGREVTVNNPQRVVAGMGSFAHIWELAGGSLVGASDDAFTTYDLASPDVQRVGDFSSLNLESILALDPDFVILTSGTGGRGGSSDQSGLAQSLEEAGIPVATFQVTTFDDYLAMLKTCSEITGDTEAYEQNGQAVADRIEDIISHVPEGAHPSVLLNVTYSGGTRVQNGSTQTGAILADLGAVNIADQNPSLLSDYSLESVIEADPEYILIVPMGNTDDAAAKSLEENTTANPAWANLKAVQNDHYVALSPDLTLYKPCENWDQAYQELYDILYGQGTSQ